MTKRLEALYYSDETAKERLEQVIRVLEEIEVKVNDDDPSVNFDMSHWCEFYTFASANGKQHDCGTSACAIGWAAQDEWFNNRGLRLDDDIPQYYTGSPHGSIWRELSNFFRISQDHVTDLFTGDIHDKPRDVSARIEHYIEEYLT